MSSDTNPSTALCILSWKNYDKLITSLDSYQAGGLFGHFDEHMIFFQEIGEKERAIAARYGLQSGGSKRNLGIANGWRTALESLNSDLVLMLEQDCPLIEPSETLQNELNLAVEALSQKQVDVFRLRSVQHPGSKFYNIEKYSRYFPVPGEQSGTAQTLLAHIRRIFRPGKARRLLGSAVYCGQEAIVRHPEIKSPKPGFHVVSSANLNWTNQSVMFNRRWMLDVLLSRVETHPSNRTINGFQDIEMALNCPWWREQDFKIGISKGVFTHL